MGTSEYAIKLVVITVVVLLITTFGIPLISDYPLETSIQTCCLIVGIMIGPIILFWYVLMPIYVVLRHFYDRLTGKIDSDDDMPSLF